MRYFIIILFLIVPLRLGAQTDVQGNVTGEWTLNRSPYIARADITVPQRGQLVIQPGVEVIFQPGCTFTIEGLLRAIGTANRMIRFHGQGNNTWGGIRFLDNADDESIIAYAHIHGGQRQGAWQERTAWGGGVHIEFSSPSISHCLIENNIASGWGGGISAHRSEALIQFNTIRNNRARNGAIGVENASPTIDNNLIMNNWGEYNGGVNLTEDCHPIISNNQIIGNESQQLRWGTGIYMDFGATADIINNLVVRNNGGALFLGANCIVEICTRNTFANNVGRCAVLLYSNCNLLMTNCIMWGNEGPAFWLISSRVNLTFDDLDNTGDAQAGEGCINADPRFIDPQNLNYRLAGNSPCRNAGDPNSPPDPDGSRADMGYLYPITFTLTTDTDSIDFGIADVRQRPVERFIIAFRAIDELNEPISIEITTPDSIDWLDIRPSQIELDEDADEVISLTLTFGDIGRFGEYRTAVNISIGDNPEPQIIIPARVFAVPGFGTLIGRIIDAETRQPIPNVNININGIELLNLRADAQGMFDAGRLPAWDYNAAVDIPGYLPYRREFAIDPDENENLIVEIRYGLCIVESDTMRIEMPPDCAVRRHFSVSNRGNGIMTYRVMRNFQAGRGEPWARRMAFSPSRQTGDTLIQGVEFDGECFYVSGANNNAGRGRIYTFNNGGELVGGFDQFINSPFGMRDLTWDGELLWGIDQGRARGFTPNGELREIFPTPLNPCRCIAWDAERSLFWTAHIWTDIIGVDRSGQVLTRLPQTGDLNIYGMAVFPDAPEGFDLFLFTPNNAGCIQAHQVNPQTGEFRAAAVLPAEGFRPGGIAVTQFWDPTSWVLAGVIDNINAGEDEIHIYQLDQRRDWLTFNSETAEVAPDQNIVVDAQFDSRSMRVGTRIEGEILIHHNGRNPTIAIPVIMNITAPRLVKDNSQLSIFDFRLSTVYPNPFNSSTTIKFTLPEAALVSIALFNVQGARCEARGMMCEAGAQEVILNTEDKNLPAGVYLLRLQAGERTVTKKVVVMK
ncbi:MAG: T9SS type A sorting domain-containing protein [Calditrichaeota bacterium]|nr:T9SS type A sorting domain-containing protein [Calditrichota bacterium]